MPTFPGSKKTQPNAASVRVNYNITAKGTEPRFTVHVALEAFQLEDDAGSLNPDLGYRLHKGWRNIL